MQSYFVQWQAFSGNVAVCSTQTSKKSDVKMADGNMIFEKQHIVATEDAYKLAEIQLKQNIKKVYALHRIEIDKMQKTLYLFESFESMLRFVKQFYIAQHQTRDNKVCSLCQKMDGKKRCTLRAQAYFGTYRKLTVESENQIYFLSYQTENITIDLQTTTDHDEG